MARFTTVLYKSKTLADGSHPIMLRLAKEGLKKYVRMRTYSATPDQWEGNQLKTSSSFKNRHTDFKIINKYLELMRSKCNDIEADFEKNEIDFTLNQFAERLKPKSRKKNSFSELLQIRIDEQRKIGKVGNAIIYENALHMLREQNPKFDKLRFQDIDKKYIEDFVNYLRHDRENGNNTIKQKINVIRAVFNQAIERNLIDETVYPFGKKGFKANSLKQQTKKIALPSNYMDMVKECEPQLKSLQFAKHMFLASYYMNGMSFVDMASLTKKDIVVGEGASYIWYKRQKTISSPSSKFIKIKINENLKKELDWLQAYKPLVNDYFLPIVTINHKGEALYNHIKNRYKRYKDYLKELGKELGFEGVNLTPYVSRHTYASTLNRAGVSLKVIGQGMGHATEQMTNTYLSDISNNEVDEANELL